MQKVIIYVPNFGNPQNIVNGSLASALITKAYKNGIFIPENATNGDMIKAIFPNIKTWDESEGALCVEFKTLNQIKIFPKYWWNAPYKTESEDKE